MMLTMRPVPHAIAAELYEKHPDSVWLINEGKATADLLRIIKLEPNVTVADLLRDWEQLRGGKLYATIDAICAVFGEHYRHQEMSLQ